ncbi:MAG: hypothetical protein KGI33_04910 [Thaumarchaeota archaeon]|nr:hypothetical protein [Nitrososphaerota archaeon]
MKLRKRDQGQKQEWKIRAREGSFRLEPMDIPFLMLAGFTLFVIVELISVS